VSKKKRASRETINCPGAGKGGELPVQVCVPLNPYAGKGKGKGRSPTTLDGGKPVEYRKGVKLCHGWLGGGRLLNL